ERATHRRHHRAQRRRPRRAVGGRDHVALRRALFRVPLALAGVAASAMTAAVEFREVAFAYPARDGRPGFAIRELSFGIESGEIFGLIGPNASGKTTVIRLLSGVLTPMRGQILLDGESLGGLSRGAAA